MEGKCLFYRRGEMILDLTLHQASLVMGWEQQLFQLVEHVDEVDPQGYLYFLVSVTLSYLVSSAEVDVIDYSRG